MSVALHMQNNITDESITNFQDTFNTIGYIPVLSTVSGLIRAVSALSNIIVSVAHPIFMKILKRDFSFQELSLKNKAIQLYTYQLMRGLVETVPLIGNLVVALFDIRESALRIATLNNELKDKNKAYDELQNKSGWILKSNKTSESSNPFKAILRQKEIEISHLHETSREKNNEIEKLNKEISILNKSIDEKKKEMEKSKIEGTNLNEVLNEKKKEIQDLEVEIANVNKTIASKNKEIEEFRIKIDKLSSENKEKEKNFQETVNKLNALFIDNEISKDLIENEINKHLTLDDAVEILRSRIKFQLMTVDNQTNKLQAFRHQLKGVIEKTPSLKTESGQGKEPLRGAHTLAIPLSKETRSHSWSHVKNHSSQKPDSKIGENRRLSLQPEPVKVQASDNPVVLTRPSITRSSSNVSKLVTHYNQFNCESDSIIPKISLNNDLDIKVITPRSELKRSE